MKLIITENDGTNNIVMSKSDTNLTDSNDAHLIQAGECGVHLVDDTDTHQVGDVFIASV